MTKTICFCALNPFSTNTTSEYTYFITSKAAKVSYTVSAEDTDYADFTATAYQAKEYQTVHELTVLGLIPDTTNTITYTITYEDGTTKTHEETVEMGSLLGDESVQVSTKWTAAGKKAKNATATTSTTSGKLEATSVGNGLYAIMSSSTKQDFVYYYDANGVLRGEIPIKDYNGIRITFKDGLMYYADDYNQISAMNNLGQLENIYTMPGKWQLHHDYAFDNDGNLVLLASNEAYKTMEDMIVKINTTTGKMTQLVDLGDLFADYKKTTNKTSIQQGDSRWDWIHINTIQWNSDGSVVLSSRETSTIIKLTNLETNPQIKYMIGESSYWKGYSYSKYSLTKVGDFQDSAGQHSVTVQEDSSLKDGQYYLYMFNNNFIHIVTRPKFNLKSYIPQASKIYIATQAEYNKTTSYYYKYLVDENAGTYTLVKSFKVPYSSIISSVEQYGNTIATDSGVQRTWRSYDNDGNLLVSYQMDSLSAGFMVYRVYKYDFEGFYFANTNTSEGNNLDGFDAQSTTGTNSHVANSKFLQ